MRLNKFITGIVQSAEEWHLLSGSFPEVQFKKEAGLTSFSLYDRQAVSKRFVCIGNQVLKEQGLYWNSTGLSKAQKTALSTAFGSLTASCFRSQLAVGTLVMLTPALDIKRPRFGRIAHEYNDPLRVTVQIIEQDGYYPDCGDVWVWEVLAAELQTGWTPFILDDEVRAQAKEIDPQYFLAVL